MTDHQYANHAPYYDLIYAWKDYRAEANALLALLAAEGFDGGRLLDAGCGTGAHLVHLRERFDVAGFDSEPGMVEVARAKLPGAQVFEGDFTSFEVDSPYDVVTCLFSGIGHVYPEERLRAAIARLAAAVRPGGILLLEPWLTREVMDGRGRASVQTHQSPDHDLAVSRMILSRVEGDLSILDTAWTIARRGGRIERFDEQLRLWMCPPETMRSALEDAGFTARLEPFGRSGIWVARRQSGARSG